MNIKNYKITPEQLCEIESHLQLASHILNFDGCPDWEDLNTACRQIADALQNLKFIREKSTSQENISEMRDFCRTTLDRIDLEF